MLLRPRIRLVEETIKPTWWDEHNPFYVVGSVWDRCVTAYLFAEVMKWRFIAFWALFLTFLVVFTGILSILFQIAHFGVVEMTVAALITLILPKFQSNLLREMEYRGQAIEIITRLRLFSAHREEEIFQSVNCLHSQKAIFSGYDRATIRDRLLDKIVWASRQFDDHIKFVRRLENRVENHRDLSLYALTRQV